MRIVTAIVDFYYFHGSMSFLLSCFSIDNKQQKNEMQSTQLDKQFKIFATNIFCEIFFAKLMNDFYNFFITIVF